VPLRSSPQSLFDIDINSSATPEIGIGNPAWRQWRGDWLLQCDVTVRNTSESAIWYLKEDFSNELGLCIEDVDGNQSVQEIFTGTIYPLPLVYPLDSLRRLNAGESLCFRKQWTFAANYSFGAPRTFFAESCLIKRGSRVRIRVCDHSDLWLYEVYSAEERGYLDLAKLASDPGNSFLIDIFSSWLTINVPQ
jgi:hypothetical protein